MTLLSWNKVNLLQTANIYFEVTCLQSVATHRLGVRKCSGRPFCMLQCVLYRKVHFFPDIFFVSHSDRQKSFFFGLFCLVRVLNLSDHWAYSSAVNRYKKKSTAGCWVNFQVVAEETKPQKYQVEMIPLEACLERVFSHSTPKRIESA